MRRETREFLSLVRDAENPTLADEERVRQALHELVASGVTASTPPNAFPSWGSASPALGPLASWGSKLSLIAACAAAALCTSDGSQSSAAQTAPIAARTPAEAISVESSAAASKQPLGAPFEPALSEPTPNSGVDSSEANTSAPQPKPASARAARRNVPRQAAPSLRAELELLRRVQAALQRDNGETALRELDAHVTSDRTLLAERRAARILALCRLGRVQAARFARAEFEREHPDSIQREAVENACANR